MSSIDQINYIDALVVGGGLTGLTLASELKRGEKSVKLIEKTEHLGGAIQSFQEDGFIYESGPTTGIISNIEVYQLLERLGSKDLVQKAKHTAGKRLILKDGRFFPLPSGLWSAISTPLFTTKDKIRILLEPFRPKGTNPNETLSSLVVRRLGQSYLDYAIDPFIGGIYAGDPTQLVPRFALPRLWKLEQEYGSFIKGAIHKIRQKKTEEEKKVSKEIFSCYGGLQSLIQRLSKDIGEEDILINTKIISITQQEDKSWLIQTEQQSFIAKKLITTIGAYALPKLLPFIGGNYWGDITNLNYAPVIQIAIGYKSYQGIPFDAFGVLAPSKETKDWLGILCPSSFFSDRAPKGGRLFSLFLGGMRYTEIVHMSNKEIQAYALSIMKQYISSEQEPDLIRIFRHERAIPQYTASSEQRLESIALLEAKYPGLILAGNIKNGIGISDRIAQAVQLARKILNE